MCLTFPVQPLFMTFILWNYVDFVILQSKNCKNA